MWPVRDEDEDFGIQLAVPIILQIRGSWAPAGPGEPDPVYRWTCLLSWAEPLCATGAAPAQGSGQVKHQMSLGFPGRLAVA
jgi:hypothetical protein